MPVTTLTRLPVLSCASPSLAISPPVAAGTEVSKLDIVGSVVPTPYGGCASSIAKAKTLSLLAGLGVVSM